MTMILEIAAFIFLTLLLIAIHWQLKRIADALEAANTERQVSTAAISEISQSIDNAAQPAATKQPRSMVIVDRRVPRAH
jgi:hypothetical protein